MNAFKNRDDYLASETSLSADGNPPILKMAEREDWTMFRSVDGLQQKAGVPAAQLRRLVLKELADNALDAGGKVDVGLTPGDPDRFFVKDDGPGLDGTDSAQRCRATRTLSNGRRPPQQRRMMVPFTRGGPRRFGMTLPSSTNLSLRTGRNLCAA